MINKLRKHFLQRHLLKVLIYGSIIAAVILFICGLWELTNWWYIALILIGMVYILLLIMEICKYQIDWHTIEERLNKCNEVKNIDEEKFHVVAKEWLIGEKWLIYRDSDHVYSWTKNQIHKVAIMPSKKDERKGYILIDSDLCSYREELPFNGSSREEMDGLYNWLQGTNQEN